MHDKTWQQTKFNLLFARWKKKLATVLAEQYVFHLVCQIFRPQKDSNNLEAVSHLTQCKFVGEKSGLFEISSNSVHTWWMDLLQWNPPPSGSRLGPWDIKIANSCRIFALDDAFDSSWCSQSSVPRGIPLRSWKKLHKNSTSTQKPTTIVCYHRILISGDFYACYDTRLLPLQSRFDSSVMDASK